MEELLGLKWINESTIAQTRTVGIMIDVFIPEFNMFIEYKNTHFTNHSMIYKEQLAIQYRFIKEDPKYKDSLLISVSTNGSMGDMNIIQFCEALHDYYLFKYISTNDSKAKENTIKLNRLIKRLHVEVGHLMRNNRWANITAETVILHIQKNEGLE